MKLLSTNSRQLQFSKAFERISQVQMRLWLIICAILIVNIAAALAYRYWPAAAQAAGITAVEVEQNTENTPAPLTIPAEPVAEAAAAETQGTGQPAPAVEIEAPAETETAAAAPLPEKVQQLVADKAEEIQQEAKSGAAEAAEIASPVASDTEKIDTKAKPETPEPAEVKIPAPADEQPQAELPDFAAVFVEFSQVLLPVFRVVALLCAIMLAGVISLALKLSLLGRLGAADKLTSAFVWSMTLICVLVPWSSAFAGFPLPAATMLSDEIISITNTALAADADWTNSVLYFSRVVAYPALALILAFAVQLQWLRSRGPIDDTINKHVRDDDDLPEDKNPVETTPKA